MKLIKREEGTARAAKRHFLQSGVSKVSPEHGSVRLHCSVSYFLPGGGAEMYPSPTERAYFGLSGAILVKDAKGTECVIQTGDTLYMPPGEERSIAVCGNEPASMLVITVNVD